MDQFRADIFRSAAISEATARGWEYLPSNPTDNFGVVLQRIRFKKGDWWIWCRDPIGHESEVIKWNACYKQRSPAGNRWQFHTLTGAIDFAEWRIKKKEIHETRSV